MTCDNIDSDANVFVQNCIIFVHCAMFCLEYISLNHSNKNLQSTPCRERGFFICCTYLYKKPVKL